MDSGVEAIGKINRKGEKKNCNNVQKKRKVRGARSCQT